MLKKPYKMIHEEPNRRLYLLETSQGMFLTRETYTLGQYDSFFKRLFKKQPEIITNITTIRITTPILMLMAQTLYGDIVETANEEGRNITGQDARRIRDSVKKAFTDMTINSFKDLPKEQQEIITNKNNRLFSPASVKSRTLNSFLKEESKYFFTLEEVDSFSNLTYIFSISKEKDLVLHIASTLNVEGDDFIVDHLNEIVTLRFNQEEMISILHELDILSAAAEILKEHEFVLSLNKKENKK